MKVKLQRLGQGPQASWEGLGRHTGGFHCWVVSGCPPGGAACVRVLASVHGVEDGVEVGCVCARVRVRSGQEVQEDRTNVSEENLGSG